MSVTWHRIRCQVVADYGKCVRIRWYAWGIQRYAYRIVKWENVR